MNLLYRANPRKLVLSYRGIFVPKVYLISVYFKKSTPNVKISRKTFASISGVLTFSHFSSTLSRDIAEDRKSVV